jgi:prophage tail gpP-like protein
MSNYIQITSAKNGNVYKINTLKDYNVDQSIDVPADAFEFIVGNNKYELSKIIAAGDKLNFYVGNKLAMEGFIDDVDFSYTLGDNDLRITGRDYMSILLDNDANPKTYNKLGLKSYLDKIMPLYKISKYSSDSNSTFDKIAVTPGENEYSVIEKLASQRNLIAFFDPYDRIFKCTKLVSSTDVTYKFSNDLKDGIRIKDAVIGVSADIKNEIIVYGDNYDENKNIKGSYKDSSIKINKKRIMNESDIESSKDAEKRAKEEFYNANKNALSVKIITNTKLPIFINRSALVQIDRVGLKCYLLVDSVSYTKNSNSGSITTINLKLMPGIKASYGSNQIPTLPKL